MKIAAKQATCITGGQVEAHNSDPVRNIDDDWGFYAEDWATWHGGYANEAAAREALKTYCRDVLQA